MKPDTILADALTARIVAQLSDAHLRFLKRKTDEIQSHVRHNLGGAPPKKSVTIPYASHSIPDVSSLTFEWKNNSDGSIMTLRARVSFGGAQQSLNVFGQQCQVIEDVPTAALVSLSGKPMTLLINSTLLEGYGIYRFVGRTGYLKVPGNDCDVADIIYAVPAADAMTQEDFLQWLLDAGISKIDKCAYKLLTRMKEYTELTKRLVPIIAAPITEARSKTCGATDLARLTGNNTNLWFAICNHADARELTITYNSDQLHYSNRKLRWMGSKKRRWNRVEGFSFSHLYDTHGRRPWARTFTLDIAETLDKTKATSAQKLAA